ncbi:MAG: rRNA maturation RNase YbeY [Holophaga sp.]|jgi:probable rRNA maturation factor
MNESAKPFKIDWSSRSKLRGPGERSLGDLLIKLRNRLAPSAEGISITYLDDRAMRKLNREHRGINQTTDILSFPANPEKGAVQHLGDLVMSLPVADKMAKKLGVSRRREVETLVIHGFLHLCMHDHEKDNGEMMALQAKLERELLESEPLLMSVKRGRKPGSKVKRLKDGSRVVVTGRAANAIARKEALRKAKPAKKAGKAPRKAADKPKRSPGRPRKVAQAEAPAPRRTARRRRTPRLRTGVLA